MFKILGTNRVFFIVALIFSIGAAFAGYTYWLVPLGDQVASELQTANSAVDQKYQEVAKMKEEYVLLQSQLRSFKELEAKGFFNEQDRTPAIEKLDKLSSYAGLLKASLKFDKGEIINDPSADPANQVVLKSPVVINISSIDDVDIYSFIKFIEEKFPGGVDIVSFKLNRTEIFNPEILRKIGSQDFTPLVTAELQFDWYTMASKNIVVPAGSGDGAVSGAPQ